MTTVDPILGRTKDTGKPAIVNYYNLTMGGTDIMDQYMANKSVRWKTDRWTMSALAFILDSSVVNATTLFGLKYGVTKPDTRGFRFQLIHDLVKPHILRRMSWPGIQTRIKQKAKDYLGKWYLPLFFPPCLYQRTFKTIRQMAHLGDFLCDFSWPCCFLLFLPLLLIGIRRI